MTKQPQFGYAIAIVRDVAAAKRFYVESLGMELEIDDPHFVQFKAANGATFAIAPESDSMDGSGRNELWWVVDDADAAFQRLSEAAEIVVPMKDMPFGRCFGVKDPAGQPRYFLQPARRAA